MLGDDPIHSPEISQPTIAFQIGCIHFRPRDTGITGQVYVDLLRQTLKGIPGVTDVDVFLPPFVATNNFHLERDGTLDEGVLSPHFWGLIIRFRININRERQDQIAEFVPQDHPESFGVVIDHRMFAPVTVVWSDLTDLDSDPHAFHGVFVVREFLTRALKENKGFQVECLGPSPMHLSCRLSPTSEREDESTIRGNLSVALKVYSRLEMLYFAPAIHDPEDAITLAHSALASEIDLYYALKMIDIRIRHEWEQVQRAAADVIRAHTKSGLSAIFGRVFGETRRITAAFLKATQYELARLDYESHARTLFRNEYRHRTRPEILRPIVEEDQDLTNWPIQNVTQLLTLFDTHRGQRLELTSLLASSLAGGSVGALVAYLLAR